MQKCNRNDAQFWQACFDAVPEPLAVVEQDGRICAVNQLWHQECQQQRQCIPQLLIGKNFFQLADKVLPTNLIATWRQALDQVVCAQQADYSLTFPHLQHEVLRWYQLHISPMPALSGAQGQPHVLLALKDVSLFHKEQETMHIAGLIYQHSNSAMLLCDAANRIVAVNPAYTRLTGYQVHDVLGKNPGFSSSGRHGTDFYKLMWHALHTQGHWQGEIWNKRKDGTEYAEWITINVIRDANQQILHYVALFSDATEQNRLYEMHWRQANYDQLTGLPNRRLMQDRLETELRKAERRQSHVGLLFIDLDHFKEVNDEYGHAVGDILLSQCAARLCSCIRASDTLARQGGDEFVAILSDFSAPQQIHNIAQQILESLRQAFELGSCCTAHISASIGIALFPDHADNAALLLENADQAMYAAKHAGKNCYRFFQPLAPVAEDQSS